MPRYRSWGARGGARPRRNVRGYTLRGRNGRVNYVGVTNNPRRRASEHRTEGKSGTMRVETRPMSREFARSWEKRRLATYRRNHRGGNPSQSRSRTGGWPF